MIDEFVKIWDERKEELEAIFKQKHPSDYTEIVTNIAMILEKYGDLYKKMDSSKVHEIDDGDYQGTLLYLIPENTYQPSRYWMVKVGYGSCSGCDTLEGIKDYSDNPPTESQVKDYMTLALHIIQALKEI